MLKKILATALAAAMILGLASVAFAASFSDTVGHEREAAIKQLTGLGLLNGYGDGTFKPENPITRAEFAKVMVYAMGLKDAAEMLTGVPVGFADVEANHWATGYIAIASSQEIVKGYPDGTFGPQNQVTYAEAITMIMRALGYGPILDKGPWPTAYLTKAAAIKLNKGISFNGNAPATRGDVAALVANAVSTPKLVASAWGEDGQPTQYVESGTHDTDLVTLLHDMGAESLDGWLEESPELFTSKRSTVKLAGKSAIDLAEGTDCTGLLGHKVRLWINDDEEVFFIEDLTDEADIQTVDYASDTTVDTDDEDGVSVAGATMFSNYRKSGVIGTDAGEVSLVDGDEITVIFEDDVPMYVVVLDYEYGVVSSVNLRYSRITFTDAHSDTASITLDEDDFEVAWAGAAAALEDLEEDDVVEYIRDTAAGRAVLIVTRNAVVGDFTKLTSSAATVDGVAYGFISGAVSTGLLGDEVTILLNKDGDIVYMEAVDEEDAETFFAIVTAKATDTDAWLDTEYIVKVFNSDGSKDTLYVDEDLATKFGDLDDGDVIEYELDEDNVIVDFTEVISVGRSTDIVVKEDLSLVDSYKVTSSTVVFDHATDGKPKVASVAALLDQDTTIKGQVYSAGAGKATVVVAYQELEAADVSLGMYYGSYRTSVEDDVCWVIRILVDGTITDYIAPDLEAELSLTHDDNLGRDEHIPVVGSKKNISKTVMEFTVNDDDEISDIDILPASVAAEKAGVGDAVYELRVTNVDLENGLVTARWMTEEGEFVDGEATQYFWVDEDTLYYDVSGSSPISLTLDEVGKWSKISVYKSGDVVDVMVIHAD